MTTSAIIFMVLFWGLILGSVAFTLGSLLKNQKAANK